MSSIEACDDEKKWFAMRVTYQRELIAKEKLDSIGIESFVPTLRIKRADKSGQPVGESRSTTQLHFHPFDKRGC